MKGQFSRQNNLIMVHMKGHHSHSSNTVPMKNVLRYNTNTEIQGSLNLTYSYHNKCIFMHKLEGSSHKN